MGWTHSDLRVFLGSCAWSVCPYHPGGVEERREAGGDGGGSGGGTRGGHGSDDAPCARHQLEPGG